ncbi:ATP-binding protein [Streptomyces sp. NPDC060000]|uniref:ATP-binding protein n=1 Tax=Streptomyces sp. NPDC060000 TaxID=3347031 RepID=UPI0036C549A2
MDKFRIPVRCRWSRRYVAWTPGGLGMTARAFVTQRDTSIHTGLELSIERAPDRDSDGLSATDATWPRRLRRIVRASLTYWRRPDLIDTANLLLTELATNALRHGHGRDIGVRLFFQDDRCVIEVNDGSPERPELQHAGPTDEGGRGLFLVEAMAESWGVSPDGTTTWCTLPLTEGPPDMEPAAVTALVLREVPLNLPGDDSARNLARVKAPALLTILGWSGSVPGATDVLGRLVDNAVCHGLTPGKADQRIAARLSITEAHELIIDVDDHNPKFLDFTAAIKGEHGRGLWDAQRLGATVTWFVRPDFEGKTVRATLAPGQVEP